VLANRKPLISFAPALTSRPITTPMMPRGIPVNHRHCEHFSISNHKSACFSTMYYGSQYYLSTNVCFITPVFDPAIEVFDFVDRHCSDPGLPAKDRACWHKASRLGRARSRAARASTCPETRAPFPNKHIASSFRYGSSRFGFGLKALRCGANGCFDTDQFLIG
jgi:hypothetical protein